MTHPNAEILRAIADGKKVQWRNAAAGTSWFELCEAQLCSTTFRGVTKALVAGETHLEWRVKPEKKTGWLNIFNSQGHYLFPTKHAADEHWKQMKGMYITVRRVACIQIEYEEGEGL